MTSGERSTPEDAGSYVDDLPAHLRDLSAAVQELGEALIGCQVPPEAAVDMTAELRAMAAAARTHSRHTKAEELGKRNRVAYFLETGEWPPPVDDHSRVEFDPWSIVGGDLNPFSAGAVYTRDGGEVVGHVTLGRCFEGPPDRAHGGVLCAIFDEVLGSVFRALGTASAFTGELTVRFERPAPLGVELEFRGRQTDSDGRRRYLQGEGVGPDGEVFARATAVFIEMKPEQYGLVGG